MSFQDAIAGPLQLTVTEITKYIRELMDSDENLVDVWVQGEVSNLARPASGHLYFSLKDPGATMKCVMWRSQVSRLKFIPADGTRIEARGRVSVYETGGQYQLYAEEIRLIGEGGYYQEFMRLKKLFEAEGLFSEDRKRAIPEVIKTIGIVTSLTGAALQDILQTIRRRNPLLQVVIANTAVQGAAAPAEIVDALKRMNQYVKPDLILLARGGGSIEDLWAFNDETVVREVAASQAPLITGIGHETDFTLADFAADLRAPTPTGAAELATWVTLERVKENILALVAGLNDSTQSQIERGSLAVIGMEQRLDYLQPARLINNFRQSVDDANRRLVTNHKHRLILVSGQLKSLTRQLDSLNPDQVLKRGYAVVMKASSKEWVTHVAQASSGDLLDIRVTDGSFPATVTRDKAEN